MTLHTFYIGTLRGALHDVAALRLRFAAERQLNVPKAIEGRAAELARELAAEVLEAAGVWADVTGDELPPQAVQARAFHAEADAAGAWPPPLDTPEAQRSARLTGFAVGVYPSVEASIGTLWIGGLADEDLLDGAQREADALRAAERWAERRLKGRIKGQWADAEGWLHEWREAARGKTAEAASAADDATRAALLWEPWTAGRWLKRILALAQLVAVAEGTSRGVAVTKPVALAVLDPRPAQQAIWLEGRADVATRLVARLPAESVAVLTGPQAGARLAMLQTAPARRFLRHLITEGQRAECDGTVGEHGAPVVTLVGGFAALEREFRTSDALNWRHLLQAGQWIEWEYCGGQGGGLWTWAEERSRGPGTPAKLRITLGDLLRRNVVHRMHRDDKALIPVLQHDPPIAAGISRQHHPAVWRTQDRLLLHMVSAWRDATGDELEHYPVTLAGWKALAAEAGLPDAEADRALGAFRDGAGDVPPLLEVTPDGRGRMLLRLAEDHAAERAFIAEGVRKRKRASRGGQTAPRRGRKRGG